MQRPKINKLKRSRFYNAGILIIWKNFMEKKDTNY